jgi:hypothetical protein
MSSWNFGESVFYRGNALVVLGVGALDASNIFDLFSSLRRGETVLVEYPSDFPSELLLWQLFSWAKEKGVPVLVDDVIDTFPQYISRLRVRGEDTGPLESVSVIKIGGSWKAGRLVGTVDVDKHSLDIKYYDRFYQNVREGDFLLNPVLGFHKFFLTLPKRELMRLVFNVSRFVGREDRVAVYLINTDVMDEEARNVYTLFREIATTIVEIGLCEEGYTARVLKSASPGVAGMRFSVP